VRSIDGSIAILSDLICVLSLLSPLLLFFLFCQALDSKLNDILSIFRYLQDKDIFEEYYKQHLSLRLIDRTSASSDLERLMIAKLKAECGHQFTSRLEGMFKDMDLSNSIMKAWKQGQQEQQQQQQQQQSGPLVCDLSVSVLTSGFWPLPAVPPCLLPLEAQLVT